MYWPINSELSRSISQKQSNQRWFKGKLNKNPTPMKQTAVKRNRGVERKGFNQRLGDFTRKTESLKLKWGGDWRRWQQTENVWGCSKSTAVHDGCLIAIELRAKLNSKITKRSGELINRGVNYLNGGVEEFWRRHFPPLEATPTGARFN